MNMLLGFHKGKRHSRLKKFADQAKVKAEGLESELKGKIWEMASNKENVNKLDGNYFPSLTDTKVKNQYFFTVSIQTYHPGNLSKK